jgi:copper chaperone CopZ
MKPAATKTCEYRVPAMHCASCAMLLEGLEDDLPGVIRINAEARRQKVTVTFDPAQVQEEAILAAALAEGYELYPVTKTSLITN